MYLTNYFFLVFGRLHILTKGLLFALRVPTRPQPTALSPFILGANFKFAVFSFRPQIAVYLFFVCASKTASFKLDYGFSVGLT